MQSAYSSGDTAAIWEVATPEMAGYIQEELNDNASRGVVNSVTNVKLVQGDLAEAWREGTTDYATVAMRYALTDVTREKATGRVVEGDPNSDERNDRDLDLPPRKRRTLETVGDPAGLNDPGRRAE